MKKYNFLSVTISVFIVITITVIVVLFSRNYIIQQAEMRVRDVLIEANSLHDYVQNNMHPTMYQLKKEGRMPDNFYSPEILSSSYISRHVFEHFNKNRKNIELPQIQYRIAAINPRNLINKADSSETKLINSFNSDRSLLKHTNIISENGIKYLYYAKPFLKVEQKCLKCHGKKEEAPIDLREYYKWESGFNWVVGTIPAIEVIKTPLIGEFRTSSGIMFGIIVTSLILLLLILITFRLRTSNKKKTEEKLELEENYHHLFNNAGDPIMILDFNATIVEANEATYQLLGFKSHDLIGRPVSQFQTQIQTHALLNKLLTNNKILFETIFKNPNQQLIPCEINAAIIPYNGIKAILYTIRDISIRKQQEQELKEHKLNLELKVEERTKALKETQAQLVQNEKMVSLGVLTSGIAHEINNPLNYMMGAYYGLSNYFEDNKITNKEIPVLLNGLKEGIEKSSQIVKGLNQLNHTSSNYNEKCDIHNIINNCLSILNNLLKLKIEVIKEYDESLTPILGNVGNLHQAFINLLTNSIQAIADKGTISISTKNNKEKVQITISDTGSGIDKEYLNKITDPFFTTKAPGEGTGLGLSITYNLIKEHQGKLVFESKKGKGTTVIITLPNKPAYEN